MDSSVAVGGGPTGSSSSSVAGWKFPSSLGELVTVTDTCPNALSASEPVAGKTKHALHHNPISIEGNKQRIKVISPTSSVIILFCFYTTRLYVIKGVSYRM